MSNTSRRWFQTGDHKVLFAYQFSAGGTLVTAGTEEILTPSDRFILDENMTVTNAFLEVETAGTVDGAETLVGTLQTNEGTPQELISGVDLKSTGRTLLTSVVNIVPLSELQLKTVVSGAGGVATAAVVHIYVELVQTAAIHTDPTAAN